MIDIIIPTMWKSKNFLQYLEKYLTNEFINKVIIIDNDYQKRPKFNFQNQKISIFKFTSNIFVNPAWNYGVSLSNSNIVCLGSDDLFIEDDVFSYVSEINFENENIDIIGAKPTKEKVKLFLDKIDVDKTKFIGDQYYGFGTCMFIPRIKYTNIPSLYKIWFGDDFLVSKSKNVYIIPILFDKYEMSTTINRFQDKKILKSRLDLDMKNAKKFLNCHSKFKKLINN
jgi:hypothetical protein